MTSCWRDIFGNCRNSQDVENISIPAPPPEPIVDSDEDNNEDKDDDEDKDKDDDVDDDDDAMYSSISIPSSTDSSSPSPPINLKAKILEFLNINIVPPHLVNEDWTCQPNIHVCLPSPHSTIHSTSSVSHAPHTSHASNVSHENKWFECQSSCNEDFHNSKKSRRQEIAMIDPHQDKFMRFLLTKLLVVSSAENTILEYKLPRNTSDCAKVIRIIFTLISTEEKEIEDELHDIIVAIIELRWMPLYLIVLNLGISTFQIFDIACQGITFDLQQVNLVQDDLIEHLNADILNHTTMHKTKMLKIKVAQYLKSQCGFIELFIFLCHCESKKLVFTKFKCQRVGRKFLDNIKKERNKLQTRLKATRFKLFRKIARITANISVDALFLSDDVDAIIPIELDPLFLDIIQTLRELLQDIANLFVAFTSYETRNLRFL